MARSRWTSGGDADTVRPIGPPVCPINLPHSIPTRDLSITELAELKGVSTKTVRRWIAAGTVDAYRVGSRLIRVRAESLERLEQPIGWATR